MYMTLSVVTSSSLRSNIKNVSVIPTEAIYLYFFSLAFWCWWPETVCLLASWLKFEVYISSLISNRKNDPAPRDDALALTSLYQINTYKCTHILLSHHFIKTIRHSDMFKPLKVHLHGVYLIHCGSKFNKMGDQM